MRIYGPQIPLAHLNEALLLREHWNLTDIAIAIHAVRENIPGNRTVNDPEMARWQGFTQGLKRWNDLVVQELLSRNPQTQRFVAHWADNLVDPMDPDNYPPDLAQGIIDEYRQEILKLRWTYQTGPEGAD